MPKIEYYNGDLQVDTLSTGRTYHTPDGSFSSLTTILGATSPSKIYLDKWRAKIGEDEANRISKEATDRGTLIHEYAEDFFNGKAIEDRLLQESSDVIHMTNNLIKGVESGIEEIWVQECPLWSKKYRYAGRTDMVGIWKGKPAIIDFKTSKKNKYVSGIKDYFLQGCGYAIAHNEMYGTGIKDVVIIVTVQDKSYQLFEMYVPPLLSEFKSRLKTFYGN